MTTHSLPIPSPPHPRSQPTASIVVVEDDPESADILRLYLEDAGFAVQVAGDGRTGLELAQSTGPDLVILDLMMPGLDGWTVCKELRSESDVPILILSARQEENDRLVGLGLGADDYVVKPFSPREIVLRVRAILRRLKKSPDPDGPDHVGEGPIRLDLTRCVALSYDREIALTPSEFRLLHAFLRRPGRTYERTELIDELYPNGGTVVPKAIDVHIGKLRQKIEPEPAKPRHVVTMRGFGYRFEP